MVQVEVEGDMVDVEVKAEVGQTIILIAHYRHIWEVEVEADMVEMVEMVEYLLDFLIVVEDVEVEVEDMEVMVVLEMDI